jgi:hypothetical protein
MLCRSYRRLCRRSSNRFINNPDSPHPVGRHPAKEDRERERKGETKALWKGSFERSKQ